MFPSCRFHPVCLGPLGLLTGCASWLLVHRVSSCIGVGACVCQIGLCVWDKMVFFAFGLGKSVKSCIGFASRCFYFLGVQFDLVSNWSCNYIACASWWQWVGGFV